MFSFQVEGTHCEGCFKLIKMTLEDYKFSDINIDLKNKRITLNSPEKELGETEGLLNSSFSELAGYTYSNLRKI